MCNSRDKQKEPTERSRAQPSGRPLLQVSLSPAEKPRTPGSPATQPRGPGRAHFPSLEAAQGDCRREAEVAGRKSPTRSARGRGPALSLAPDPTVNSLRPQLRFSQATSLQRTPPAHTPQSCVLRLGRRPRHPNSQFLLTVEDFRRDLLTPQVAGAQQNDYSRKLLSVPVQRAASALNASPSNRRARPRPTSFLLQKPRPRSPAPAKLHPSQGPHRKYG